MYASKGTLTSHHGRHDHPAVVAAALGGRAVSTHLHAIAHLHALITLPLRWQGQVNWTDRDDEQVVLYVDPGRRLLLRLYGTDVTEEYCSPVRMPLLPRIVETSVQIQAAPGETSCSLPGLRRELIHQINSASPIDATDMAANACLLIFYQSPSAATTSGCC